MSLSADRHHRAADPNLASVRRVEIDLLDDERLTELVAERGLQEVTAGVGSA